MTEELVTKLQAARSRASKEWPYISPVLFSMKLVKVDDPSFKTLGVDKGWRLYWSPDFVEKCTVQELATSLLHESMHCFWDHARRFEKLSGLPKDHHVWNVAGDCAINYILDEDGFQFPAHIKPVRFSAFGANLDQADSTETNYAKLLLMTPPPKKGSAANSKNGRPQKEESTAKNKEDAQQTTDDSSDSGAPERSGDPQDDGQAGSTLPSPSRQVAPSETGDPAGAQGLPGEDLGGSPFDWQDCGSIAGGLSRDYELDEEDSEAPVADEATKSVARAQVVEHVRSGKHIGRRASSSFVRAMDELLKPKVSWRRQLAVVLKNSLGNIMGRSDYTLMRISRRDNALKSKGFSPRLPAMRGPLPPQVAVILDTSGSISKKELNDALSEILGIVRAVGASRSVAVIPCSTQAHEVQYVKNASQVKAIKPISDGGTYLVSGFDAAMELKRKPNIIVVITDGETDWPDKKPPGVELVLVLLNNKRAQSYLRPWMVPIILEN
jgi:predicted metal-dependent peptidase